MQFAQVHTTNCKWNYSKLDCFCQLGATVLDMYTCLANTGIITPNQPAAQQYISTKQVGGSHSTTTVSVV